MKNLNWFCRWFILVAVVLAAGTAGATVRRDGTWPEEDKSISVDLTAVPRAEAVRKVAAAAGWNIVFRGLSEERVDVHVKNQPATRVLELVLGDENYVLERDRDLIQIRRDDAPPAAAPAAPSGAPAPSATPPLVVAPSPAPAHSATIVIGKKHKHGKNDRTIFGGSLRVEPGETVDGVVVLGGSVEVLGTTDDLVVLGGSAHVYPGAHVIGDIVVLGGSLTVDDDATVDGELVTLGGSLHRGDHAKIGGQVKALSEESDWDHDSDSDKGSTVKSVARTIGRQITKTAILFMLGAVIIALGARRMQLLESEIAMRPMRSIAMGVAAIVIGTVLLVLLCITVVGIPVALCAIVVAVLGLYAGMCATLSAMGRILISNRSENPYVHLAIGCGLFLIVGFIPFFGSLVTIAVLLAGIGAFTATRAAGFIPVNR